MKKVELKQLNLLNFKKIEKLTIDFSKVTEILGKNAAGKSTIADAYNWLLYGKNQLDQTDFSIKTLDSQNNVIHKLSHEVEGVFELDGETVTFKRVYNEKWVTKRGNDFEELTGHETAYFINDVPKSQSEFKTKVSEMIPEAISKIISNPLYFNSNLKWQERRLILTEMAGEISNDEITSSIDVSEVVKMLEQGKDLEEQKKVIAAQRKRLKDEIAVIPTRVDELQRMKPEAEDFEAIEIEIGEKNDKISEIQNQINDLSKGIEAKQKEAETKISEHYAKKHKLEALRNEQTTKVNQEIQEANAKISELKGKILSIGGEIRNLNLTKKSNEDTIARYRTENVSLKTQYEEWNAKQFVFDSSQSCCPTCKQSIPDAAQKETELREAFNKTKLENINGIKANATERNTSIKTLTEANEKIVFDVLTLEGKVKAIEEQIAKIPVVAPIKNEPTQEMIDLETEINSFVTPIVTAPNVQAQNAQIQEIRDYLDTLNKRLNSRDQAQAIEERITKLNAEQKTLSQELANADKLEFQIDKFNKKKMELVEEKINSKFTLVKFKMFEEQLNGGETPTCICLVDGVPFNDVNTAMKVNASLDIINALQYHFGIFAPVFIDGKESVSELIKTDCQIVCLKVDETAQKLTVLNLN